MELFDAAGCLPGATVLLVYRGEEESHRTGHVYRSFELFLPAGEVDPGSDREVDPPGAEIGKENAMNECPHCGNTTAATIESTGGRGEDRTLLCVRPVKPSDAALLVRGFDPKTDTDADGNVPCGMQWSPS